MPPDAPLPDADIALIEEWISPARTTTEDPTTPIMRRLLLCLLVAGAGTFGFARAASAYPQFQFSSGTNKCGQCHYVPSGGGAAVVVGAQRERRHDQHGRRRRLSARRGDAAVVARAGDGPSPGRHPHRRRRPGVAARGVVPDAVGLLRARRVHGRVFVLRRGRPARRGAAGGRRDRRALHADPGRTLHLARALLHVAPERDRPVRAAGALLRALRHPLRRAHLLRPPLHRLRALQRDVQPVGRLRRGPVGAAPDRLHAAALQLPRRAAVGGRARIGRGRVLRIPVRRHGGAGAAGARSASARR